MNACFIGGPLDGRTFDHHQIDAVARVLPVPTESGTKQFLVMPGPAACDSILAGKLDKDHLAGALHPYERRFLPGGGVEYRDASGGAFDEAMVMAMRDAPLSAEAQARKDLFGEYADRFIEQVQTTEITGETEVSIIWKYADQDGIAFNSSPASITPTTKVRVPGDIELAKRWAKKDHIAALIATINSVVRNAPTGDLSFPDHPGLVVQIVGFELEVKQH